MKQKVAESNLNKWFWVFKYKLVDEYPEYHRTFDCIVSTSDENSVLYEVMEFSHRYLEVESELKGGFDNLNITDYLDALEYGYMEWVN